MAIPWVQGACLGQEGTPRRAILKEPLFIFVVYVQPLDYPNEIVVRKFTGKDEGIPVPLDLVYRGTSLPDARKKILGLSPHALYFPRSESDERQILECWI